MNKNIQLNTAQKKAIRSAEKPILVLAGPGTGKTRTMTSRIAYFIKEKEYDPERILTITFTNKAAQEVKERLTSDLGEKSEKINAGTFHRFCLTVLRENHNYFNLSRHFNIADTYYQEEIIRNFMNEPAPEQNILKGILRGISNHKMRNIPLRNDFMRDASQYYKNSLKSINAIDFDDILLMTKSLFLMKTDVLEKWQNSYDTILIDEFQDTDQIQYEIIRDLAWKHKNIFAVGDDDQSIFAWRGADPGNIKRYIADFKISESDIVILDKNYRSSEKIYATALKPLTHTERLYPDKHINVVETGGKEVVLRTFANRTEETDFIADQIKNWVKNDDTTAYSDVAIIYPRHIIGQQLEKTLLYRQIPCRLASGKSLLDHPSIQKILAYLRFVLNPKDAIAFRKIVELYLPAPTFKKLEYSAYRQKVNFRQAITRAILSPALTNVEKMQLKQILAKINNVLARSANTGLFNLIKFILSDEDKEGIFWLKQFANELSDPLIDFPENYKAILEFNKAVEKNYFLIINSGKSSVDNILKNLLHQIVPNSYVMVYSEFIRKKQHKITEKFLLLSSSAQAQSMTEDELDIKNLRSIVMTQKKGIDSDYAIHFIAKSGNFAGLLFKFLQSALAGNKEHDFANYTIVDLETTDKDVENCEIVEIGAVKVREGKIVAEYQTLVKPQQEIHPEATKVHRIDAEMLKNELPVDDVWGKFTDFIEEDMLIAHNGVNFDFQILNRVNKNIMGNKIGNIVFDTLPFAQQLFPGTRNSIDALIEQFNLDSGTRHRALDDVIVLKSIFDRLLDKYRSTVRKTSLEEITTYIATAMQFEDNWQLPEDEILFQVGYHHLMNRSTKLIESLIRNLELSKEDIIQSMKKTIQQQTPKLPGDKITEDKLHEIIYLTNDFENRFPDQKEAMNQFIQFLALYTDAQTIDSDVDAVNLMTLHTCKGLEFLKVIIAGLEDNNLPSYWSYQTDDLDDIPINKKQEEQRRLFYVGMTRAKDELLLTCSQINENLREGKPSPFLEELTLKG